MPILAIEVFLGALTFTGSLIAFGKLQELLPSSIKGLPNQNAINFSLLGVAALLSIWLIFNPTSWFVFLLLIVVSLVFGLCLVIPIGGADMPTVISLLNSYAGLSASLMGFILDNYLHNALTTARPGYGWLSEEKADDPIRLKHSRVFIVDPIDGTSCFIRDDDNGRGAQAESVEIGTRTCPSPVDGRRWPTGRMRGFRPHPSGKSITSSRSKSGASTSGNATAARNSDGSHGTTGSPSILRMSSAKPGQPVTVLWRSSTAATRSASP